MIFPLCAIENSRSFEFLFGDGKFVPSLDVCLIAGVLCASLTLAQNVLFCANRLV